MAATQQGILAETPTSTMVEEQDIRFSLPEATMFIVASSGALWVLLFGLTNFLLN